MKQSGLWLLMLFLHINWLLISSNQIAALDDPLQERANFFVDRDILLFVFKFMTVVHSLLWICLRYMTF